MLSGSDSRAGQCTRGMSSFFLLQCCIMGRSPSCMLKRGLDFRVSALLTKTQGQKKDMHIPLFKSVTLPIIT